MSFSLLELLKKSGSRPQPTSIPNPQSIQEVLKPKTFGGVPLDELDKLAKSIYHGIGCKIDEGGLLEFAHRSNRGRQILRAQLFVEDDGKLINLGGHYPGQWWSMADEFAKQANELFSFKKE